MYSCTLLFIIFHIVIWKKIFFSHSLTGKKEKSASFIILDLNTVYNSQSKRCTDFTGVQYSVADP